METKFIIGRKYLIPSSGNLAEYRETDKYGVYFKIDEPHTYIEINGLVGFTPNYASYFIEQPEALHETQKKQILDYLKTGKSITKLEALKMFGCWNSGDCIFNLRKEGYTIETTMITNGKKRFASYKLIENGKEN
jgi:hypothetical protein